ncbi:MAG: GGDEF domain-containing protein [Granulosicoccus sp.]|nr:GGDEF domain-containing protein [Granulosicoccus sp.]
MRSKPPIVEATLETTIPMDFNSQEDEISSRNVQVTKYASFGTAMVTIIALALHRYLDLPIPNLVSGSVLLCCLVLYVNSFMCDRQISAGLSATLLLTTIPCIVAALAWNTGGLNAPVMLLLIIMPVLAAMTRGSQSIIPSLVAVFAVVIFYTTLNAFNIALPESFIPPEKTALLRTNATLMIAGIMGIACHFYEVSRRRFQYIAETDGLTNIRNRRAFEAYLQLEWRRQQRLSGPLSMIMLDIDDFKGYNDEHGHLAGDDCLRAVANIISNYTRRASEQCFRYGGEEFAIILSSATIEEAVKSAEGIRVAVEKKSADRANGFIKSVTISAGVAEIFPDQNTDPNVLISEADRQLYESKLSGRNRVSSADRADVIPILASHG